MFPDEVFFAPRISAPSTPAEQTAGHRALYLRWRPRRFEDVVGQDHVTRTLRNAVVSGHLAHAYLFTGPRGTGKTSVARILYRASVCPRTTDGDPCNSCPLCLAALDGRAMDLLEIDAASNRGIDDIRDLREKVAYRPSDGKFRVFIIDEAHELTSQAWDAFLKTLEEPPEHVIFVLATTEAHKVPATIVSRCQRFDFRRISFEAIRGQLETIAEAEHLDIAPDVVERLARTARGGLRDAESLLDQLGAFSGQRVEMDTARAILGLPAAESIRETVEALTAHNAGVAISRLTEVAEEGTDPRQFVEELVNSLRAMLLIRVGAEGALRAEFSPEELNNIRAPALQWGPGGLSELIRALSDSLARTRDLQQFQVQVELALLAAATPGVTSPAERSDATLPVAPGPRPLPNGAPGSLRELAEPYRPTMPERTESAQSSVGAAEVVLAPVVAPVASAPGAAISTEGDDDLSAVRRRWQDVVERVTERRTLVGSVLVGARMQKVERGVVTIRFDSKLGKRSAEAAANRILIEEALLTVLGRPYKIRGVVAGDEEEDGEQQLLDDPVIGAATRLFGGRPRRVRSPAENEEQAENEGVSGTLIPPPPER